MSECDKLQALEDLAQIYCPKARAMIVQQRWIEATSLLLSRIRELDMALQSLTPGGSEYVGNPERCAAHAKERMRSLQSSLIEALHAKQS